MAYVPDLMRKSVYDANANLKVDVAEDADTVDGKHADEFALVGHEHSIEEVNLNGHLIPESDGAFDLGSELKRFRDGYFSGTIYAGDVEFKNGWRITEIDEDGKLMDGIRIVDGEGREVLRICRQGKGISILVR